MGTTFRRGCFEFRGRFIGLKDKKGKEIYEGDILAIAGCEEKEKDKIIRVVEYDDKAGYWRLSKCLRGNWDIYNGFFHHYNRDLEIIGNIYENKELLEVK